MTFIDDDGLDENDDDKPANNWKKVADWTDDGTKYRSKTEEKYDDLKNGPPYREYPYDSDKAQQTIRIDSTDIDHKKLWCRQIDHSKPLFDQT
jgi:uncharacterized lipoprotein YehR (DUF1307 family)